jgi:hypothetical protein
MSIKDNLGPAITALILPMVFSLMYAAGRRKARRVGGVSIVEYPGVVKTLGILAIGASAIMLFVAFRAPEKERVMALSICGAFSLLFFFLPLEFFFRRIEFDDREIVIHRAWRKVRRIPSAEVMFLSAAAPWKGVASRNKKSRENPIFFVPSRIAGPGGSRQCRTWNTQ